MQWMWFLLAVLAAPAALAEPWLCTDAEGNQAWSYDPESAKQKNCVHKPIASPNVWRKTPAPGAELREKKPAFPVVDARVQKSRDQERRRILERELTEERKSLADAMKALDGQMHARNTGKGGEPATAALKAQEDRVRQHLNNIANLERELAAER